MMKNDEIVFMLFLRLLLCPPFQCALSVFAFQFNDQFISVFVHFFQFGRLKMCKSFPVSTRLRIT